MNKKIYLLLSVLLAWSFNLKAQTAEIESVEAVPGDNDVTFDLTVDDFPGNVGAISLFIGYDPSVLTYTGTDAGTISGFITNNMVGSNQVGIQWTNTDGQAIDGVLLTLKFDYSQLGGECDLTFNAGCEFADILLNSITVAYTPGHIGPGFGVASLTIPDKDAVAGPVSLPITAAGFPNNVAAMTLFINYDNTVLTFAGTTPGMLTDYFANASNGVIGITWSNTGGIQFDDTLLTLNFNYSSGMSPVQFQTGCEIVDIDFNVISTSFNSGSVSQEIVDQTMTLETQANAIPGTPVGIDIYAAGYDVNFDVAAITLFVEYDPACMTFVNASGGTISGAFANVITPGHLGITWTNSSGEDIDGTLLTLNFNYNFGNCDITFEGGCDVADKFLTSIPTTFIDGSITQGSTTAMAEMHKKMGVVGQPITFPIVVSGFPTNVGAISLFIGFDPAVLQFNGTTDGTLNNYFANYMPSWQMVGIQWSDLAGLEISPSSPVPDTLLTLNFTYLGGYCDLTFAGGCEFAENDLDFIPVSFFNGAVVLGTKFNVKAFLEGPYDTTNYVHYTYLNSGLYLPIEQPYDAEPWHLYMGDEAVESIPNADVVDWVLLGLRVTNDGPAEADTTTTIATRACFITEDGTITDLDGEDPVMFGLAINDDVYVTVAHRNHLAIMSANALTYNLVNGFIVYTYDFTDGQSKAYEDGLKPLVGGKYGMYAGDADGNGDVNMTDFIDIWWAQFGSLGYYNGDFDLNGDVNMTDFIDYWWANFGQLTKVPRYPE